MILDRFIFRIANAILIKKNKSLVQAYRQRHGRMPNIACPQRYTERMLWRKVLDHNPQFVLFSDKLATKEYVRRLCPQLALARTLWVGRDAHAIPDEVLRGDVYVKASHGWGFHQRVRGECDRVALKKQAECWLNSVHGTDDGQWAYSQVEPKLFVEESVGDVETGMLEFNVRVSDGRMIMGSVTIACKTPRHTVIYLDAGGRPIRGLNIPEDAPIRPLPDGLEITEPYLLAVEFAKKLSVGVDYVRCDFMWNGRELFGGEITVYPAAGVEEPANARANAVILDGWDLLQSHFFKIKHRGFAGIYAGALRRRLEQSRPTLQT